MHCCSDSDNMGFTATKNETRSVDRLVLDAENKALQQEVKVLRRKTRALESQAFIRAAESAADFIAGQMDRVFPQIRNANYGREKLVSAIDGIRRYDALLSKTEKIQVNPVREAVSVIYLSMNHYVEKSKKISQTIALQELTMLAGRINKYFEMRCRPADCFSKGGWQDHMFMFVLPATDRNGARTLLDRVMKNAISGIDVEIDISYGISNYAADVKEIDAKEPSSQIASRLVDAARRVAKNADSEYSGRIKQGVKYSADTA